MHSINTSLAINNFAIKIIYEDICDYKSGNISLQEITLWFLLVWFVYVLYYPFFEKVEC